MPTYTKTIDWPMPGGDSFQRAQTFTSTPGMHGWTLHDTSAAGAPTAVIDSKGATLTFAADAEVEVLNLFQNDVLIFDIDELVYVEMFMEAAAVSANTVAVWGVASARNSTEDSVAAHAWFRLEGSTTIVTETDDGVTDDDDNSTGGAVISADVKRFLIDFSYGKADVRFYIDGARVSAGNTFDMSGYSGGLQPYVQLRKASSTDVTSLSCAKFRVKYNKAYDG